MFNLADIDTHFPHAEQLSDTTPGPITLFNTFHVDPAQVDAFLAEWGDIVREFKSQPGQLATQVYRGVGESGTVVIQAVWESVAHYRAALSDPAFQARLAKAKYPDGTVAMPYLYRKVAIAGGCVA